MVRGDLTTIPQLVTGSGKEQNRGKTLLTTQNISGAERTTNQSNRLPGLTWYIASFVALAQHGVSSPYFGSGSYSCPLRVQLGIGLARPLQIKHLKTSSYQKPFYFSAYNKQPVPACGPG